mgnify:CR=1 FL=1
MWCFIMGINPRDIEEILYYYKSYGKDAPEYVKHADLISLADECLRLREVLGNIVDIDPASDNAVEKMIAVAKDGIGKVEQSKL